MALDPASGETRTPGGAAVTPVEPVKPAKPTKAESARNEAVEKERAEARRLASIGGQVVLDPASPEAIAARGGAADTMVGNIHARNEALVARAGNPEPVVVEIAPDPINDPQPTELIEARKAGTVGKA